MSKTIAADFIITMNNNFEIIKNGLVSIDNGKIDFVGKEHDAYCNCSNNHSITILIPGLVNSHAHLSFTLLRGMMKQLPLMRWLREEIHKIEPFLTQDDLILSTQVGLLEMINSGITTVCDFDDVSIAAPIFQQVGERGVLSTVLSDSWFGELQNREFDEKFSNVSKVEQEIRQWHKPIDTLLSCMVSPHAPYTCSRDLLKQIENVSSKYDIPVHTHMAEAAKEVSWFRKKYNQSPVEYFEKLGLFNQGALLAHCTRIVNNDVKIIADKKLSVAHCPISNSNLSCGVAPVKKMLDSKIAVGLGTDSAASSTATDIISEMKVVKHFQSLRYKETISPLAILKMATIDGAKCLGLEQQIGSIEKGKKADLVYLSFDSLPNISGRDVYETVTYLISIQRIKAVYVNGRPLKDQSSLLFEGVDQLLCKARGRTSELRELTG
jgi:5-methylthioadenosine/S-adenosylhomocysteine deaminase